MFDIISVMSERTGNNIKAGEENSSVYAIFRD